MISAFVLCMGLLQAVEDFTPRIETLRFHVERLGAITVPAERQAEKEARLAGLDEMLDGEIGDEETFNACYNAIDEVRQWLWANAAHRPAAAEGVFEETDDAWRLQAETLTVRLSRETLALEVRTPGHAWKFAPSDAGDLEFSGGKAGLTQAASITAEPFNTGYSVGMTLTLSDFPGLDAFRLFLTWHLIGAELVLDIVAHEGEDELLLFHWPKAVVLDNAPDTLSVIPRMQGMLVPGDWHQPIRGADLSNSRSLYMPWWGQIQDGAGVQTILETSDDAGCEYVHPRGGPTRVSPRWYGSLGKLRYQRTIRYIFDDDATYVRMAKRYRRFVKERGHFVSLREKLARTPALDGVIGKPVIHLGSLYHFVPESALFNKERIEANHNLQTFDQLREQLEGLKEKGVDAAYVHLDGWGYYGYDNGHPDVLPPGEIQGGWDGLRELAETCARLDYLFAVHDQYRDFYYNAVSFDDRLTVMRLDGTREEHSTWCGGPQTILSPRFAPEYVRRNHDLFRKNNIWVRGAYLDVFAVVPLEESAQSLHPMTRSECARHRRECFDLLRARGYVVSSEEPADYLVPALDLVHHGPYATYPNIGGGDACGIPVPLFSLVYHDSILLPWEMGEDGGWGIPKGDAAWLHCLLNAGLPYLSPHADEAHIERVLEAADWAGHCAFQEMTSHEFLDGDWRRQRATFANNAQIEVDFNTREYHIRPAMEYGVEKGLTMPRARESLERMRKALASFSILTDQVLFSERFTDDQSESYTGSGIKDINFTDWETRHLGFANWPRLVEGTLIKQDYLIKKLTYALEQAKSDPEMDEPSQLRKLRDEYETALVTLNNFLEDFQYVD